MNFVGKKTWTHKLKNKNLKDSSAKKKKSIVVIELKKNIANLLQQPT